MNTWPKIGPDGTPFWEKDPSAVKDYLLNWADWLAGDTIQTSVWAVPDGITKDSDTSSTSTATINLSSGTAGTKYRLTNTITTSGGRTELQSIDIIVRNR